MLSATSIMLVRGANQVPSKTSLLLRGLDRCGLALLKDRFTVLCSILRPAARKTLRETDGQKRKRQRQAGFAERRRDTELSSTKTALSWDIRNQGLFSEKGGHEPQQHEKKKDNENNKAVSSDTFFVS